jgi:hypothetical protein
MIDKVNFGSMALFVEKCRKGPAHSRVPCAEKFLHDLCHSGHPELAYSTVCGGTRTLRQPAAILKKKSLSS